MLRIFFYITIISVSFSKLPNDVRWVKESREYRGLCKTIYRNAFNYIESNVKNNENIEIIENIDYFVFQDYLKDGNSLNIVSMECAKKECIAISEKDEYYHIKMRSLSNTFIAKIKKNMIDYTFNSKLDVHHDYKKKYAIIVDLDETVLDNSDYQVWLHKEGKTFSQESWSDWVKKEEATLVYGAKDFFKKIRKLGIQVIFISNRMHSNLEPTINNLKNLKIHTKKDIYLLRKDKEDKKTVRRAEVFEKKGRMANYPEFKVIGYLGDAYADFPKNSSDESWGTTNFIFPNPMYGKW